jgi:hypothetical protein
VSSRLDPGPWLPFKEVELLWDGTDGAAWSRAVRGGLAVHAIHLRTQEWAEGLLGEALAVLGASLEPDFLVVPADPPASRWGRAKFLGALEALLEACSGRGVKVVLRPVPGATPRILELLHGVHGDAVGICWNAESGEDPEPAIDRIHCAVGGPDADPRALQRWGYRWNLALPAEDPTRIGPVLERMRRDFPPVLFPAELPATVFGRPVLPDPEVSLGRIWDRAEPR